MNIFPEKAEYVSNFFLLLFNFHSNIRNIVLCRHKIKPNKQTVETKKTYFVLNFSSNFLQWFFFRFCEGQTLWDGVTLGDQGSFLLFCQTKFAGRSFLGKK
jgi:hypothetical protein